jgi:dienelactone hydrolase
MNVLPGDRVKRPFGDGGHRSVSARLLRLLVAALVAAAVLAFALPACGGGEGPAGALSPAATSSPDVSPAPGTPAAVSPAGDSAAAVALARQFPDPSGPLDLQVTGTADWDGARVRDVTYRSEGATVTATLSIPDGDGPFPAVLYAPGVTGSRDMFAADVAAMQREGIAALAVDPPDRRDPFVQPISADPELAAEAHVRYVTDLRRGLDVLRSLPGVDPDRLGYVGYSWGGFVGGYLAGLGEPVSAYVLTYAGADWVGTDPTAADGFPADPAAAVGAAAPGAYLFIAGVDDFLFSRESVTRYFEAAKGDTRLAWLPGGHGDYWAAPDGAAAVDHRAWLERRLR